MHCKLKNNNAVFFKVDNIYYLIFIEVICYPIVHRMNEDNLTLHIYFL